MRRDAFFALTIAVILGASAWLALVHLGHVSLWDDEAHVCRTAANRVRFGVWTGWDGRNLSAEENGMFLTTGLRQLILQLDYLVVAAAFKVGGQSEVAARLPFAVAGLAALVLFLAILRRDFPCERWLHAAALALLGLSASYLLYIRTCRYYALSVLFGLLVYHTWRRYLASRNPIMALQLAAAAALLFMSSALTGTAFLLALAVLHGRCHRREFNRRDWAWCGLAVVLFLLAALPFAAATGLGGYGYHTTAIVDKWYIRKPVLLWWNLRDLSANNYLPWMAMVGLAYFLATARRKGEHEKIAAMAREWITLCVAYVFFLAMLSAQPVSITNEADIRYLVPLLPFFAGLAGVLAWFLHLRSKPLALALVAVLLSCNVLGAAPSSWHFLWLLPAFVREVHEPYPTSYSAVTAYLRRHARPNETFLTAPPYTNYPIVYYNGDRLRNCCLLTHHSHLPERLIRSLRAPLYRDENCPDWFVAFGWYKDFDKELAYFSRAHLQAGRVVRFSYRRVVTLDVYHDQTQRPEVAWHSFGPRTNFNRKMEAVYIYRRFP